jgi:hypothetical protein
MSSVSLLRSRGVVFLAPETAYVAPDVDAGRIAPGVTVHPGCRLGGAELAIGPGCVIGAEGPVTVVDCQLGAGVRLAGGYFERSTFLDGFGAGSGAHVRPGCLFEEESSIAHAVGVKQTVFLPWVTAGSLVNFCDALVAGGTGRGDHSEIGSSYVHFNFTPRRDKATASLIGDVPHGVLLDQPAVFLGGQGGLVGPCLIAHGTVIPAGQVWREDVTTPGCLVARPSRAEAVDKPYDPRRHGGVRRLLRNNLLYIGNIAALDLWYRVVRARFMLADPFRAACHAGARRRLAVILEERLARLDDLAAKVERSLALGVSGPAAGEQRAFTGSWPRMRETLRARLAARGTEAVPAEVQALAESLPGRDYLREIQALPAAAGRTFTAWLASWPAAAAALQP